MLQVLYTVRALKLNHMLQVLYTVRALKLNHMLQVLYTVRALKLNHMLQVLYTVNIEAEVLIGHIYNCNTLLICECTRDAI
jgi:hypothetical protein